jgi:hypothetical protein
MSDPTVPLPVDPASTTGALVSRPEPRRWPRIRVVEPDSEGMLQLAAERLGRATWGLLEVPTFERPPHARNWLAHVWPDSGVRGDIGRRFAVPYWRGSQSGVHIYVIDGLELGQALEFGASESYERIYCTPDELSGAFVRLSCFRSAKDLFKSLGWLDLDVPCNRLCVVGGPSVSSTSCRRWRGGSEFGRPGDCRRHPVCTDARSADHECFSTSDRPQLQLQECSITALTEPAWCLWCNGRDALYRLDWEFDGAPGCRIACREHLEGAVVRAGLEFPEALCIGDLEAWDQRRQRWLQENRPSISPNKPDADRQPDNVGLAKRSTREANGEWEC